MRLLGLHEYFFDNSIMLNKCDFVDAMLCIKFGYEITNDDCQKIGILDSISLSPESFVEVK